MLTFCPVCGNMLTIGPAPAEQLVPEEQHMAGRNRFTCRTCPYMMWVKSTIFERKLYKPKEVGDVLGGADSWKNVDKTTVNCADTKCEGTEAYFRQVQIRSADEPMTTFYKCTTCAHEWRER